MTRPPDPTGRRHTARPGSRFGPFQPLGMLTSLWSATAMVPVNSGAAAAYRTLFVTLRRLVVGRRLTVRLDDGDLTMTVTDFESRLDVRGLSVGQLNDVRLTADDVRWRAGSLGRITAVAHNVHVRPGNPAVLVAAPVDVTLELPAAVLDDLFRWAAPRLSGEAAPDGVARLRLARRPRLGYVEVAVRVDGSMLWLTACRLGVGSRRWRLPAGIPAYPVQLPVLARGVRLSDIAITPEGIRLSGTLPEWRTELPRKRLDDVINQLDVTGVVLNLGRLGRMR